MIVGTFAQLTDVRDGLAILGTYNADAAVVIRQYIAHVPEVLIADISGPDVASLAVLGWIEHPVEGGMFYSLSNPTP